MLLISIIAIHLKIIFQTVNKNFPRGQRTFDIIVSSEKPFASSNMPGAFVFDMVVEKHFLQWSWHAAVNGSRHLKYFIHGFMILLNIL